MIYIYGNGSYGDRIAQGWTEDEDYATTKAKAFVVTEWDNGWVDALRDDGTYEYDAHHFRYEYTDYTGPTITARIKVHQQGDPMSYIHRTPIDCAKGMPTRQLTVEHPWRINEVGGIRSTGNYSGCQCGTWWEIEGSPKAVHDMVAKHGYAEDEG